MLYGVSLSPSEMHNPVFPKFSKNALLLMHSWRLCGHFVGKVMFSSWVVGGLKGAPEMALNPPLIERIR